MVPYTVSGTITLGGSPLAGVTVSDGTNSATTDASGNYSLTETGAYTLTPSLSGYTFTPATLAGTVTGANVTGENFTATVNSNPSYSISGTITLNGAGLSGVSVSCSAGSATTNSSGAYTLNGVANGSYTLTPSLSGYTFTPATQGATVAGANLTSVNFTANVAPGAGSLVGAGVASSTAVNLTAVGTADWASWPGYNDKATGGAQIGNYVVVGSGTVQDYANDSRTISWSDGTPTASGSETGGVYVQGVGAGFSISAPADTTSRTLIVYVGGWLSSGHLAAHLSDSSAPDYVNAAFSSNSGSYDAVFTLTYQAASAGQTLTVTWIESSTSGNVTLQAAALVGGGAAAPTITSALSATGTVGTAFSYTITAGNSPSSYNATGLPAGLSVNTSTGAISGTPTAVGATNVTISATNSSGTGTATLALSITASAGVYTVSGTISLSTGGYLAGVTVTLTSGSNTVGSATTNSSGQYTITGVANGSYTLAPSLTGYTFTPTTLPATVNGANVTGDNFTATINPPASVATPAFSPAPGAYNSTQTVTISCATSGAAIYYTTDGSTPTAASTKYTAPISISATTLLQTIAIETGLTSPVISGVYNIAGSSTYVPDTYNDTDGNGYPDEIKTALGVSLTNSSATPLNMQVGIAPQALTLSKLSVKLNFAKAGGNDQIMAGGSLPIPSGFVASSQTVVVDVGGVVKIFTLTSKGKGVATTGYPAATSAKNDHFALKFKTVKGKVNQQTGTFTAQFNKGAFASSFTDVGLLGSASVKKVARIVPVVILFNNQMFQAAQAVQYTATANKTGLAEYTRK
jgi:hypothetical protein